MNVHRRMDDFLLLLIIMMIVMIVMIVMITIVIVMVIEMPVVVYLPHQWLVKTESNRMV